MKEWNIVLLSNMPLQHNIEGYLIKVGTYSENFEVLCMRVARLDKMVRIQIKYVIPYDLGAACWWAGRWHFDFLFPHLMASLRTG